MIEKAFHKLLPYESVFATLLSVKECLRLSANLTPFHFDVFINLRVKFMHLATNYFFQNVIFIIGIKCQQYCERLRDGSEFTK